jgi:hypothetical protein
MMRSEQQAVDFDQDPFQWTADELESVEMWLGVVAGQIQEPIEREAPRRRPPPRQRTLTPPGSKNVIS